MNSKLIRMLIVDNRHNNRLKKALQEKGIQVEWKEDLTLAKKEIDNSYFDLIVSDYYLPDGRGTELIKYVRCFSSANKRTALVILSGHDRPQDFDQLLKTLACTFISKDFYKGDHSELANELELIANNNKLTDFQSLEVEQQCRRYYCIYDLYEYQHDIIYALVPLDIELQLFENSENVFDTIKSHKAAFEEAKKCADQFITILQNLPNSGTIKETKEVIAKFFDTYYLSLEIAGKNSFKLLKKSQKESFFCDMRKLAMCLEGAIIEIEEKFGKSPNFNV